MNRKTILIQLTQNHKAHEYMRKEQSRKGIIEMAREVEYDILDLYFTKGAIPIDLKQVAGAIVSLLPDHPTVLLLKKEGIPVVRLGQFLHPLDHTTHAVLPDWNLAGQLAATHLEERGFSNIAMVINKPILNLDPLYKSFVQNIETKNVPVGLFQFSSDKSSNDDSFEHMSSEFIDWVKTQPKPLALFTAHSIMACRLITICLSHDISIPEDLAIICVTSDDLVCESVPIHLSSVKLDSIKSAMMAMNYLIRIIEEGNIKPQTLLCPPDRVIKRKSTDCLAGANPMIEMATRYIWDHFREALSVDDVARHVSVSRRKLELGFRKFLNRSIGEELRKKRLEDACYFLRTTSMKVDDIARFCGMGEAIALQRAMKKVHSMTPSQYRAKVTT
jgi:LacI family transcriptional regulator